MKWIVKTSMSRKRRTILQESKTRLPEYLLRMIIYFCIHYATLSLAKWLCQLYVLKCVIANAGKFHFL